MLINRGNAISTSSILLVPYEPHHVTTYHEWMQDATKEIQSATASEPLSLEEEYVMQRSWRTDHDKLTFIACLPLYSKNEISDGSESRKSVVPGKDDASENMIGDVNLFLFSADEDEEGCIGELELMIAPQSVRRKGYGRAAIVAFLNYIETHLEDILEEYRNGIGGEGKMKLLMLRVKIGGKNDSSIRLFEGIGFVKISEGENWFGEVELVFEGAIGGGKVERLLEKFGVEDYVELPYVESKP